MTMAGRIVGGLCGARLLFIAAAMTAMSSMHKHVKQWAGEEKQERQVTEYMRPVFGDQVKSGNSKKRDEGYVTP